VGTTSRRSHASGSRRGAFNNERLIEAVRTFV
jgi:hypothetical protein